MTYSKKLSRYDMDLQLSYEEAWRIAMAACLERKPRTGYFTLFTGTRDQVLNRRFQYYGLQGALDAEQHYLSGAVRDVELIVRGPNDISATCKAALQFASEPVWHLIARPRGEPYWGWSVLADLRERLIQESLQRVASVDLAKHQMFLQSAPVVVMQDQVECLIQKFLDGKPAHSSFATDVE